MLLSKKENDLFLVRQSQWRSKDILESLVSNGSSHAVRIEELVRRLNSGGGLRLA